MKITDSRSLTMFFLFAIETAFCHFCISTQRESSTRFVPLYFIHIDTLWLIYWLGLFLCLFIIWQHLAELLKVRERSLIQVYEFIQY